MRQELSVGSHSGIGRTNENGSHLRCDPSSKEMW